MKKALLVIDVQNEYFTGRLPVSYPPDSLDNIIMAIKSANEKKIPVILIQHTSPQVDALTFVKGSHEWELIDEIKNLEYDVVLEKNFPGSFTGTGLEEYLGSRDIDTLTISGYMSQMCCDTTARQAFHIGYKVEFLSDATGTLAISNSGGKVTGEELHRAVLVTQAMKFSHVISTKEWIDQE